MDSALLKVKNFIVRGLVERCFDDAGITSNDENGLHTLYVEVKDKYRAKQKPEKK